MAHKVLVVDDSAMARKMLRDILDRAGYEVVEATDGLSALENYVLHRPVAVFLDLTMKGMHGFEVLKRLRELDAQARVIVVSADLQDTSREMAQELGAMAFVAKPVTEAALRQVLQALREELDESTFNESTDERSL